MSSTLRRIAFAPLLLAPCASASHAPATGATPTPAASATPTTPPSGEQTGQLVGGPGSYPGAIAGLHYRTPTQMGVTDATGFFHFAAGEPITFSIADVDLRPAT